eukprot:gene6964-4930_t
MTLCTRWASEVTVEMDPQDGRPFAIINPRDQTLPPHSVARLCASTGNPITIRPRSQMPPATTGPIPPPGQRRPPGLPMAAGKGGGSGGTGLSTALAVIPAAALRVGQCFGLSSSDVLGGGFHATYWVPDTARGETGLLELIHRRGGGNEVGRDRHPIVLQTRPLEELQRNFSVGGDASMNIDLSHPAFRLSKTALAMERMQQTINAAQQQGHTSPHAEYYSSHARSHNGQGGSSTITLRPEDLQLAVAQNLQTIQEDEYFLVRYRDYSQWAVTHYPNLVRREGTWRHFFGKSSPGELPQAGATTSRRSPSPQAHPSTTSRRRRLEAGKGSDGYVEQCFVVHVGSEAGELIPITEKQLLFGLDIIHRMLIREVPAYSNLYTGDFGDMEEDDESSSHAQFQLDSFYRALNRDQFNSLWAVLGDGFTPIGTEGEEAEKMNAKAKAERDAHLLEFMEKQAGGAGIFYTPPAWYDWSPGAIRRRLRHQLHLRSQAVGAFTLNALLLFGAGFIAYTTIPGVPAVVGGLTGWGKGSGGAYAGRGGWSDDHYNSRGGGRGAELSRGGWWGGRGSGSEVGGGPADYVRPARTFFGSILMGPKDVFDYLLAPEGDLR